MHSTTPCLPTKRQQVRARYGEIGRQNQRGCGGGASCCGPVDGNHAETDARTLGYSADDLAHVPEGSGLGSGCGSPTTQASIQPGERVVDLGSGAGLDCFLA